MKDICCEYYKSGQVVSSTEKSLSDINILIDKARLAGRKTMCSSKAEHVLYAIEEYSEEDLLDKVLIFTNPLELSDAELDDYIHRYPNAVFMAFHKGTHQKACQRLEERNKTRKVVPITLKVANAFVDKHHRHHAGTAGCKFAIGLMEGDTLIGVAICGRPVSRHLDDGEIVEINRVCTIRGDNSCSILYGACCRIAREMGYRKIITYTLQSENGASLKASNFICEGIAGGYHWNGKRYKRSKKLENEEMKKRWSRVLTA